MSLDLIWLPPATAWKEDLEAARRQPPATALAAFQRLSNTRMDFVRAGQLDKAVQRYLNEHRDAFAHRDGHQLPVLRVALLGSSTLSHLLPSIRLGALRRGFLLDLYTGPYGMYLQELMETDSGLVRFRPEFVCFLLDAAHLVPRAGTNTEETLAHLERCWSLARQLCPCEVMQQTVLPRFPRLMGNNEQRLPASQAHLVTKLNEGLRERATDGGVSLLSLDTWAAEDGIAEWFDPALWYTAKQEVHPRAAVVYGDQFGRLLAALRGRSAKCLVLDLDNTLWGGVVGDDGVEGLVLGQGSPTGEAFLAFQQYALHLAERGVLLAVCSKNDEQNAMAPFETHPEMVLRRKDIACFVANWQDKATNLRTVAETLNIGLDALVFVDDNPAERQLIRRELPMVAVPELPEEPAGYVACLAAAGYFEAVALTAEDRQRTELYRANADRAALRSTATDMAGYLDALHMQLVWSRFDELGLKRIVQLINKTNQFNLTTRRYTEAEVRAVMDDAAALTLQLRLLDVHGDNGMIGVVLARPMERDAPEKASLAIDTWLMSCRVLGRGVEAATLNLLAVCARNMGYRELIGTYVPTAKNGMVREHYSRLGFSLLGEQENGSTQWVLNFENYTEQPAPMRVVNGDRCKPSMFMAS